MSFVALVLAAGAARRFGSDKLSADFRGEPLVHHAIRAARAAPVERVIVVCGPGLDMGKWPGTPPIDFIRLDSSALSETLKAGVLAAGETQGVFVFLGDMPLVPHDLARQLAGALGDGFGAVPCLEGRYGHPVLLSAHALNEIAGLSGDEGAGRLLRTRDDVVVVEVDDCGIHADVDVPADLAALSRL